MMSGCQKRLFVILLNVLYENDYLKTSLCALEQQTKCTTETSHLDDKDQTQTGKNCSLLLSMIHICVFVNFLAHT